MVQETNQKNQQREELFEKVVLIRRVSKTTKGGKRISFAALVVVGDQKGKVGVGYGKAPDVASAVKKGARLAKRDWREIPLVEGTIPHPVWHKKKAVLVMLKPARLGTGLIAGGAVRVVAQAAGVQDLVAKIWGSRNPITTTYAAWEAFAKLKKIKK